VLDFSVTFFITILNLAVLYLALRKLLWRPLTAFLDARARKIREDLEGAEAARLSAEASSDLYRSLLEGAEAEAEAQGKEAEERAREEAKAIVEAARAEAEASRAEARKAAEREAAKAREALAGELASLAAEAAAILAGREAEAADERSAELLLRELGAGRAR